MIVLLITSLRK
uniref:Uncharacterized protein n=1 Tax=Arundo donax TaxID=35708 RepID=A0A0A9EUG4_ARUDO